MEEQSDNQQLLQKLAGALSFILSPSSALSQDQKFYILGILTTQGVSVQFSDQINQSETNNA